MEHKDIDVIDKIKSLQSAFLTLKNGVESSCTLLKNFLNSDDKTIVVTKEEGNAIVSLIIFDSMISEDLGKSIMDYFDFTTDNEITKKYKDEKQCSEYLDFLVKYIIYRSEFPVDIGEC